MSQNILYGIDKLDGFLEGKKVLLVKDSAYEFLGISDCFDAYPHVEFAEFTPNPLYEQVVKGVELFNNNKCNCIVAVGGGSTIDVAKCIKLYCKMNPGENFLLQEKKDSQIPLYAVPTTAGTGSESTKHAVIYYEGSKQSISHESIIPNVVILEPSLLKSLPVYQKKCTMLDALSQAIESFWSVNSTDVSKEYSKKAILAIKNNWEEYIFENTDESMKNIMEAANYAGRAINITATTAAHAMSYKLTSLYKLPHGHAVFVCLPLVWDYMLSHTNLCIDSRGEEYLKKTLSEIASMIDLDYAKKMFEKLEMDYPVSFDREKEIKLLTESVNPVRLKNNPVSLSNEVLKNMYERIVK